MTFQFLFSISNIHKQAFMIQIFQQTYSPHASYGVYRVTDVQELFSAV